MRAFKHVGKLLQILFAALLFAVIFQVVCWRTTKIPPIRPQSLRRQKSDASKIESPAPVDRARALDARSHGATRKARRRTGSEE